MNQDEKIFGYLRERDEMLRKRSIIVLREFMRKWNLPTPDKDEIAWITLHKTITSVGTLPMEDRIRSKKWLLDRGYHSYDDGDVPYIVDDDDNRRR
jgi:hypothetical protein